MFIAKISLLVVLSLGFAGCSVFLSAKNRDGSGWGFLSVVMLGIFLYLIRVA